MIILNKNFKKENCIELYNDIDLTRKKSKMSVLIGRMMKRCFWDV